MRDKFRMFELLLTCVLANLPDLKNLPGVESAKVVVACPDPRLTVIHLRDWHFIEFPEFKADVEDEVAPELLNAQYILFAREVQSVQDQQELFLSAMASAGHKDVWLEGLIPEFEGVFQHICHAAARNGLYEMPNPISVGAAARLFVRQQIRVHALDTDQGLRLTTPLDAMGRLREVSDADIEKRENLMIRQLQDRTGVAIVVLGGGHDLSNNLPADVRLITVTVKGYRQASGESSTPAQ